MEKLLEQKNVGMLVARVGLVQPERLDGQQNLFSDRRLTLLLAFLPFGLCSDKSIVGGRANVDRPVGPKVVQQRGSLPQQVKDESSVEMIRFPTQLTRCANILRLAFDEDLVQ